MKVALVIEHFDATRGSAEHLAVWLAKELAARGEHDVHVICHDVSARINRYRQATLRASFDADLSHRAHPPTLEGSVEEPALHLNIRIHKLHGMRVNTAIGYRLFGARVRRWCEANKPDVVHSLSLAYPGDVYHACAGVYAAMQAQAAASRHTPRGSTWKRMLLRLSAKQQTLLSLEKKAVEAATKGKGAPRRVISLCRMMTEQFQRFYGVDGGKIVELATPRMDLNGARQWTEAERAKERAWFRAHYQLGDEDRVAVFVGHDFRRKGLRHAIEAIALTRTKWKLLVVGQGKAREYVQMADQRGLGDSGQQNGGAGKTGVERRVLFIGPTREMDRIYAAADALILPTFYDAYGLAVLEAFGHGLPVVTTEFLGAGELVKEHRAGAVVASPRESPAMAKALDELPLPESAEGLALAERAREASAGMSPSRYIDSLLAIYKDVRKG